MRGKVARQLRQMIELKPKDIKPPRLFVKRTEKGTKLILDPNGVHQAGDIRYNVVEMEKDICQLHTEPLRQMYQDFKKQYKEITRADMKKALANKEEGISV